MRGDDREQGSMFSYRSLQDRIPQDHPLRPMRAMVDRALEGVSPRLAELYARTGRPSIPPERLLRALLLQILFSVRSERQLMEALEYNLLYRWFVGLGMDDAVWVPTTFTKNRDRRGGGGGPRNPTVNFRGERRLNDTHASTTDPEARLMRMKGKKSKLSYQGHVLMENRHGLVVDSRLTRADGFAEREAALSMLEALPGGPRVTLGADRGYDTQDFVAGCRALGVTPHVVQNTTKRSSRIDGRTTRHPGYAESQRRRKRIEEVFGWRKTVGLLRKTRHRGRRKVDWVFAFTAAAYNPVRLRNLALAT